MPKVPLIKDDPRKKVGWDGSVNFVRAAVAAKAPTTKAATEFPPAAIAFAISELVDVNSMSALYGACIRDVEEALGFTLDKDLLPPRRPDASILATTSSPSSSSSSSSSSSPSSPASSSSLTKRGVGYVVDDNPLSPDHHAMMFKRPRKPGPASFTALYDNENDNKGGSGSHKTKEKKKRAVLRLNP